MKSLCVFTFFLFVCILTIQGQALSERDSLLKKLNALTHQPFDTNRVIALNDLALYYQQTKPDTTYLLGQQAYELSCILNYPKGKATALIAMADGLTYLGDYGKSLKLDNQAKDLYIKMNNNRGVAHCLIDIADTYMQQGEWQKALITMQESYTLIKNINTNPNFLTAILSNIGECYYNLNQLDSALTYLNQALYLTKTQNTKGFSILYILGDVVLAKNNIAQASAYYQENIKHLIQNDKLIQLYETYYRLSKMYEKTNQRDSVLHYAKLALVCAQKSLYTIGVLKSSQRLATLYKGNNDSEALHYYEIAILAKDSLYSQDKVKQLLSIDFEEKQHAQELEATKVLIDNKNRQSLLFGILTIFAGIGFLLFRNNRQKQKANTLLAQQRDEINEKSYQLEKSLDTLKSTQNQLIQKEKLASLGELTAGIAHEIQNPLNFVNNFSELSVDLAKDINDEIHKPNIDKEYVEELLTDLTANQEKINHHGKRASSIVKGMLEHSRASTGTRELTDINKLADEYLRLSYHGLRAKDKTFNADYKTDFDVHLPKIEVVPQDMGRVLLNLINNAFYAVNERKQSPRPPEGETYVPTVIVSTHYEAPPSGVGGQIVIKVSDNGTGMPESVRAKVFQPFFTTKPTGSGTGLGLSLSYDIVTKGHGGTLEVISNDGTSRDNREGVGTEFIIHLPYVR